MMIDNIVWTSDKSYDQIRIKRCHITAGPGFHVLDNCPAIFSTINNLKIKIFSEKIKILLAETGRDNVTNAIRTKKTLGDNG
jgi:hypothetical protein